MDQYIFLTFSLPYLVIYLILFKLRKDLRYKLLVTGIIGGIGGLISENLFFRDYWNPPTLIGVGKISIEEFIFGLSVTGVSAASLETIFRKKLVIKLPTRLIQSSIYYLIGMFFFFAGNIYLHINSIFTCSIGFIFFALLALLSRKDLLRSAIFSTLFLIVITVINYLILSIYSPFYWQKYWLLYSTPIGGMILGKIPWTEILWYFSFGLICGTYYEFAFGLKREDIKQNENIKRINPLNLILKGLKINS